MLKRYILLQIQTDGNIFLYLCLELSSKIFTCTDVTFIYMQMLIATFDIKLTKSLMTFRYFTKVCRNDKIPSFGFAPGKTLQDHYR